MDLSRWQTWLWGACWLLLGYLLVIGLLSLGAP